jgi:hypothetical protein
MVFSSRDYGATAQILDGLSVRAIKKSSSLVVLDFPSSISAILFFCLAQRKRGRTVIREGSGIFPTKNAFLLFDITFYSDGAGGKSLTGCLAWRCLGFSLSLFFPLLLFSFSIPITPKLLILFLMQGGKPKERKGTIKHHLGMGGFPTNSKEGLPALLFPLFFFFLSGASSVFLPRPRRPCWAFSTCSGLLFDWFG